mgnify:CR=1 FL=1
MEKKHAIYRHYVIITICNIKFKKSFKFIKKYVSLSFFF